MTCLENLKVALVEGENIIWGEVDDLRVVGFAFCLGGVGSSVSRLLVRWLDVGVLRFSSGGGGFSWGLYR